MNNSLISKAAKSVIAASTLVGAFAFTAPAVVGGATIIATFYSSPAEAKTCGKRVTVGGVEARGLVFKLRKKRAERRAERAWRSFVAGQTGPSFLSSFSTKSHPSFGLGTRFSDLKNAKNVKMNCKGVGGAKMRCSVTATPCTK